MSPQPSPEANNDWLDEISNSLTAATKRLNEVMAAHPQTQADYLPVLEQLVQVSLRLITMRHEILNEQPWSGPVDNATGRGEDDGMEARISALEKDVAAIKTDVAVIRSNYATKEDLQKELHATTWKIVGTVALLCGAVFWMARNIAPTPAYAPARAAATPVAPNTPSPISAVPVPPSPQSAK